MYIIYNIRWQTPVISDTIFWYVESSRSFSAHSFVRVALACDTTMTAGMMVVTTTTTVVVVTVTIGDDDGGGQLMTTMPMVVVTVTTGDDDDGSGDSDDR